MDIRIEKMAVGTPKPPDAVSESENLKKQEHVLALKDEAVKEQKRQKEALKNNNKSEMPKFVMSELDMKELLLMMGSRGPTKAVEELVRITKKYRDQLKHR